VNLSNLISPTEGQGGGEAELGTAAVAMMVTREKSKRKRSAKHVPHGFPTLTASEFTETERGERVQGII
jgi:hypothetical protein